jgi:hypothetical protein
MGKYSVNIILGKYQVFTGYLPNRLDWVKLDWYWTLNWINLFLMLKPIHGYHNTFL